MPPVDFPTHGDLPHSLDELRRWIHDRLTAPDDQKAQLVRAVNETFDRQRDLWESSKAEAVQALSIGFADEVGRLQEQLQAKDQAVQNVARYFEGVVAGLTDRTHRDPKTRLLNFDWFMHRLEAFLAVEQRVHWCAAGVVDIARFKSFNDRFGHATGDRIIQRVARLLSEQTRSGDLLAKDRSPSDLHARFGGDEFTFLVQDLPAPDKGLAVASRFKEHVERFPWTEEDPRLVDHPVHVDVGVVCLQLGPLDERRGIARTLAEALIARADQLMYEAKHRGSRLVHGVSVEVRDGRLADVGSEVPRPDPTDRPGGADAVPRSATGREE